MMDALWQACASALEAELPPQQFQLWIKPLIVTAWQDDTNQLVLQAPNRFKLDWIRTHYLGRISQLASEHLGQDVQVSLELAKGRDGARESARETSPLANSLQVREFIDMTGPGPARVSTGAPPSMGSAVASAFANNYPSTIGQYAPSLAPQAAALAQSALQSSQSDGNPASISLQERMADNTTFDRTRLNTQLTFDSFVQGKANQLARAAAMSVADNPGTGYNPLFFYGGVGLGKTHLIHAVGNSILTRNPNARIRYIHAEQFVSDMVRAYRGKSFEEFKRYYRSLDLLLIDDIQFFSGKQRSQEEFFYAFEALVQARKQIIITSDTYPRELADIDDRLKSRFDSGLTVAIEPPELEMRVAILVRKAELEGTVLAEEVGFFIAKHLRSNVRELEGALKKVLAYSSFHGKPVTTETAREALKDLLTVQSGQITVENIQKTVADFYKIRVADMYSKRRPNNIAMPRQVAMYLAKELTQKSLPEIGELFGGRDHTTVLHAVRKISELRGKQQELNHALHVLEQMIKG